MLLWIFLIIGKSFNRKSHLNRVKNPGNSSKPFISVIIAFQNEAEHLNNLFHSLEKQTLNSPFFEIIWINDRSTDNGPEIIDDKIRHLPNQKLVSIKDLPAGGRGKRNAIEVGIQASRGDVLVFTDGDCIVPATWLKNIFELFNDHGMDIYAGSIIKKSPGILGRMINIEQGLHNTFAESFFGYKTPILGFGANWAVKKELFDRAGGFSGTSGSLSGDDDLSMQRISKLCRNFYWDFENPVNTVGPGSWPIWCRQKRRHLGAAINYRIYAKLFYALFHLIQLILLAGLFVGGLPQLVFAGKYLTDLFLIKSDNSKQKYHKRIIEVFLFQFYYVFENWIIGISAFLFPVKRW